MACKATERMYLEMACRGLGWAAQSIEETESPDFLVDDASGALGVEVHQVFRDRGSHGSIARRDERERAVFLHRAAREYYASGGPPAHVTAELRGSWRNADPKAFAQRVRELVPEHEMDVTEDGAPYSQGNPKLRVRRLPAGSGPYDRWKCLTNHIGWVMEVSVEVVAGIVASKARSLERYRLRVERVALLLVADHSLGSGMLATERSLELADSLGFDAVYWLDYPLSITRIDRPRQSP